MSYSFHHYILCASATH
uniref:Uncharacterized protein n=1 Tax=Arundo donax TaxID=35708 RepID=A0A0A9B5A1_ARUDO